MAVSRVSLSSITQGFPKSRSFLDGNSAYIPNSYESIATVTVGAGGSSSISFTSIPSTYNHLQLRYIARNGTRSSAVYGSLSFNLNGTYGVKYHYLEGDGSSATAGSGTPSVGEARILAAPGTSGTANAFGVGILDISDYANTNKYKTVRALSGSDQNGAGNILFTSYLWDSTSAVSSITLYAVDSGTIPQYSSFALYGVKG